jgi:hypothetical protein
MLEKERTYVQQIESLHEHMRRMQKFVHTLIKFNNNNHNNNNHVRILPINFSPSEIIKLFI